MNREQDVKHLLLAVNEIVYEISNCYKKSKSDETITELPKIKVKTGLEHLRSILDYCAVDVYEKYYSGRSKKVYFIYAATEAEFKSRLKLKFKKLRSKNNKIYDIFESIQPHKFGNDWLLVLCESVNSNKHDRLSKQQRENDELVTEVPGLLKATNSKIVFEAGSTINGIPISKDKSKDVVISDDFSLDEIRNNLNPENPFLWGIKRNFDKVEFVLGNSQWDTLELLVTARDSIKVLITNLYREL